MQKVKIAKVENQAPVCWEDQEQVKGMADPEEHSGKLFSCPSVADSGYGAECSPLFSGSASITSFNYSDIDEDIANALDDLDLDDLDDVFGIYGASDTSGKFETHERYNAHEHYNDIEGDGDHGTHGEADQFQTNGCAGENAATDNGVSDGVIEESDGNDTGSGSGRCDSAKNKRGRTTSAPVMIQVQHNRNFIDSRMHIGDDIEGDKRQKTIPTSPSQVQDFDHRTTWSRCHGRHHMTSHSCGTQTPGRYYQYHGNGADISTTRKAIHSTTNGGLKVQVPQTHASYPPLPDVVPNQRGRSVSTSGAYELEDGSVIHRATSQQDIGRELRRISDEFHFTRIQKSQVKPGRSSSTSSSLPMTSLPFDFRSCWDNLRRIVSTPGFPTESLPG